MSDSQWNVRNMKRKAADIASFFRKSSKKQPNESKTHDISQDERREREKEQTDSESEEEQSPQSTSPKEILGNHTLPLDCSTGIYLFEYKWFWNQQYQTI